MILTSKMKASRAVRGGRAQRNMYSRIVPGSCGGGFGGFLIDSNPGQSQVQAMVQGKLRVRSRLWSNASRQQVGRTHIRPACSRTVADNVTLKIKGLGELY